MDQPDSNNRQHVRTRLRAEVTVSHPRVGELRLQTRDISDGGAYVQAQDVDVQMGDLVEVQMQGLAGEPAPVVLMRVVRVDRGGLGLQFVEEAAADVAAASREG